MTLADALTAALTHGQEAARWISGLRGRSNDSH